MLTPLDVLQALYHRRSGITHLVTEPVPEILAALSTVPMTVAALADHLAVTYGMQHDPSTQALLSERLAELETAGLVWRL
jgi:PqqD family protein of HPr-rel-A system